MEDDLMVNAMIYTVLTVMVIVVTWFGIVLHDSLKAIGDNMEPIFRSRLQREQKVILTHETYERHTIRVEHILNIDNQQRIPKRDMKRFMMWDVQRQIMDQLVENNLIQEKLLTGYETQCAPWEEHYLFTLDLLKKKQ